MTRGSWRRRWDRIFDPGMANESGPVLFAQNGRLWTNRFALPTLLPLVMTLTVHASGDVVAAGYWTVGRSSSRQKGSTPSWIGCHSNWRPQCKFINGSFRHCLKMFVQANW